MADYKMELHDKFYKQLDEIFEQVQKSENKDKLPYGKPMNLSPILSSVAFVGATAVPKPTSKNLDILVRNYGELRKVLSAVAADITVLTNLESNKREFVKKRENVRLQSGLPDFEKLNKDKQLKSELKRIKDGISEMSWRIDKRMDGINKRIVDLSKLKRVYEKKNLAITNVLNGIIRGEKLPEGLSDKFKDVDQNKITNYKRNLSDGITLCEQIITKVKERKDSLIRSMWLETPYVDKSELELILTPAQTKKGLSKEM